MEKREVKRQTTQRPLGSISTALLQEVPSSDKTQKHSYMTGLRFRPVLIRFSAPHRINYVGACLHLKIISGHRWYFIFVGLKKIEAVVDVLT